MKLVALELAGFRGFNESISFDLDATAIILVGANGQGKTSLFDAVLWALTGSLARLGEESRVVSIYSSTGEARVSLEMRGARNELLKVTRSTYGKNQRLLVEHEGEVLREEIARARLLEAIWPEALATSDGLAALTTAITRSVYLQQDLVRDYIEADTDQDRFNSVSELVGAGRVSELQLELERARRAWSQATNARHKEVEEASARLRRLEEQLASLSPAAPDLLEDIGSRWTVWWNEARRLGLGDIQIPDVGTSEAFTALDEAIRRLDALQRATERRFRLVEGLLADIIAHQPRMTSDVQFRQEALDAAGREVAAAEQALAKAERQAAEERRVLLELREARDELSALAQLALRHLGETCPVCTQTHDINETRLHLEELIGEGMVDHASTAVSSPVADLADVVQGRRRAYSISERELQEAQESIRNQNAWIAERDRRLQELEITLGSEPPDQVSNMKRAEFGATLESIRQLQHLGERLALSLTRWAEQARRSEIERQLSEARREVDGLNVLVRGREETGQLAGTILEALREATFDVVQEQLERIAPLLQRIYASVDPHPAFKAVRFLTRVSRGRGRLVTALDDQFANLSSESPLTVLSSSQMNALAVAVFLAFNLGVPSIPLQAALLDDPLQSLDDVNLLGLIDLLRRTRDQRQLIVSTHDSRFGGLLERKLRPVSEADRTIVIQFNGWNREGPTVTQRDVARDLQKMRIAALT